jgi:hypothetical protein
MKQPRTIWLLSYRPLAASPNGPWKNHPEQCLPFEDASCRREPDFRADPPTISTACRPDFAGKLKPGDLVVYVTVKGRYGTKAPHRRLVAVLSVIKRQTHERYARGRTSLATNCIVPGNGPLPWSLTEGFFTDERGRHTLKTVAVECGQEPQALATERHALRRWDRIYKSRKRYSNVIVTCKAAYLKLHDPILVPETTFAPRAFPGTQNGATLSEKEFLQLLSATGIRLSI